MSNIPKRERISRLARQIATYDKLYHGKGVSKISDSQYDALKMQLREIAPEHPRLHSIGFAPPSANSVKRDIIMGSLNNAMNYAELAIFLDAYPSSKYLVTPKIDGLAVELVYQDYEFIGAYTRGDGMTGMDVTLAVRAIPCIPMHINLKGLWIIGGEAFIGWGAFRKTNVRLLEEGQKEYTLPRALAAGTLKLTNEKEIRRRGLDFLAWELRKGNPKMMAQYTTESQRLRILVRDALSIPIVPCALYNSIEETDIQAWAVQRGHRDYPTDGMVISVNNVEAIKKAGEVGGYPRAKIAYKFPPVQKWSKVTAITDQIGRTGKLTPVVWFEKIILDGSEVQKATGSNYIEMKRKGICLGARVLVQKAGDIIPEIVKAENGVQKLVAPKVCPVCGCELIRKTVLVNLDGTFSKDLWCTNTQCPSQIDGRLKHFLKTLKVLGGGPDCVMKIGAHINSIAELYKLTKVGVCQALDSNAKGVKFYNELHAKKTTPLNKFLQALGYQMLGKSASLKVAKIFGDVQHLLEDIRSADLRLIFDAAGYKNCTTRERIIADLISNFHEIEDLSKVLTVTPMSAPKKTCVHPTILKGKVVCITGTFERTREELEALIEASGGEFTDSVTKRTTHLLVGEDPGKSKLKKAEQFGTPIIRTLSFKGEV